MLHIDSPMYIGDADHKINNYHGVLHFELFYNPLLKKNLFGDMKLYYNEINGVEVYFTFFTGL